MVLFVLIGTFYHWLTFVFRHNCDPHLSDKKLCLWWVTSELRNGYNRQKAHCLQTSVKSFWVFFFGTFLTYANLVAVSHQNFDIGIWNQVLWNSGDCHLHTSQTEFGIEEFWKLRNSYFDGIFKKFQFGIPVLNFPGRHSVSYCSALFALALSG